MTRVLVTGGAGFVGANVSVSLAARHPDWELIALDNLYRRGSELNVPRLESAGIRFVRGDVRDPAALAATGPIDALVECSAEPSALIGADGDVDYAVHTNLTGAYNCLELARSCAAPSTRCWSWPARTWTPPTSRTGIPTRPHTPPSTSAA